LTERSLPISFDIYLSLKHLSNETTYAFKGQKHLSNETAYAFKGQIDVKRDRHLSLKCVREIDIYPLKVSLDTFEGEMTSRPLKITGLFCRIQVSFVGLFCKKRPIIVRSLLIVATLEHL